MWGLIITASSVIAQFRRGFSTTSALTYPFPPRTAVIGMIGAVLGVNKKTEEGINLLNTLDRELLIGVKWVRGHIITFGINNMYGKNDGDIRNILPGAAVWADRGGTGYIAHLPTPAEFVIYPKYEIALISHNRELLKKIEQHIQNCEMQYAPYLGVQGALARLEVSISVTTTEDVMSETTTEYTVPEPAADVYPGEKVFIAIFPRKRDYFDRMRKVMEYTRVYWANPGERMKISPKRGVWDIDGQAIPAY